MRTLLPIEFQEPTYHATNTNCPAVAPTQESLQDDGRIDGIPVVGIGWQEAQHQQRAARIKSEMARLKVWIPWKGKTMCRTGISIDGAEPLSVDGAAEKMGCSRHTIYHVLKRGVLLRGHRIEKVALM